MDTEYQDSSVGPGNGASDIQPTPPADSEASSKQSFAGLSSWAKNLKIPQSSAGGQEDSPGENCGMSAFARFTSSLSMRLSPKDQSQEQGVNQEPSQSNVFGTITKGLVNSSKSAATAVSVKARHFFSQNKQRYQVDGYDLDLTCITENILAMGFPAWDMSSEFFGYVEGFHRNQMEEVTSFLESHHKGSTKFTIFVLKSYMTPFFLK